MIYYIVFICVLFTYLLSAFIKNQARHLYDAISMVLISYLFRVSIICFSYYIKLMVSERRCSGQCRFGNSASNITTLISCGLDLSFSAYKRRYHCNLIES